MMVLHPEQLYKESPVSDTLDRLRAVAAATAKPNEAAAPVAAQTPAASQTPAATLASAAAAPAVSTAAAAVMATLTPEAASEAPVSGLPTALPAEASQLLSCMMKGGSSAASLAAITAATDEGGVKELFPFATVKNGNWQPYTKIPNNILDHMPIGTRPFRMVYLSHRIGALGWQGAGSKTTKQPPLWSAAAPIPAVSALAAQVNADIMTIGSRVQFTKAEQRTKFDTAGRLSPEVHVFGWTPKTGFIVLVCGTFTGAKLTLEAFADHEGKGGMPMSVELASETQTNPKATDPNKARWEVTYISPSVKVDAPATELAQAFETLKATNPQALAEEMIKFATAGDYVGLSLPQLVTKLAEYNNIP
jgi:hypothetical protein